MSEKPILFNTEMVKAIIEGRKTVTRRIIKDVKDMDFIGFVSYSVPKGDEGKAAFGKGSFKDISNAIINKYVRPPYKLGDILYVRETWFIGDILDEDETIKDRGVVLYRADERREDIDYESIQWKPSIHMPKKYARTYLRVTKVKAERLLVITEKDIQREGIKEEFPPLAEDEFRKLWDSTIKNEDIKTYGYKANPWVWVIEFERIERGNENNEEI